MGIHITICRLCLKICESFSALEGNMKDILGKLVPKIGLTVMQEPVVCTICADMLIKCFDFKMTCLYTRDYIVSFGSKEDNAKLDLKDVYLSKVEYSAGNVEDQDVCGFCIESVKNCSAISFDVEKGDDLVQKMIKQYLPELDLRIIKKPVICAPCRGSLEDLFHFMTSCLTVEKKIQKYCETLDMTSKGQMELSNLLQFMIRDLTTSEVDDKSIGIMKVEKQHCEETEIGNGGDIFNHMDNSEIIKEEVEYKIESFMDVDDVKFNNEDQFIPKNMFTCKQESNYLDDIRIDEIFSGEIKMENSAEMEDQKFLLNEEIEIKTDEVDFMRLDDGDISPQLEVASRLHIEQKCTVPKFEADVSNSHIDQTLPNKNVSTGIIYQCAFCSFQTKYNQRLKNHILKHCQAKTMYKCDSCSYQAKNKNYLNRHLILHKSPSEVFMYKCESCSYQTKYRSNLIEHFLIHKDPSEVTMYKCDSCLYQTKRKRDLNKHMLMLKHHSGITLYKCDFCSYQTNNKRNFNSHLLTHKDRSEVTMYKCESCSYQTKRRNNLIEHFLIHKDPSEVTMYKCDSCLYQTKRKRDLNKHMLMLKHHSEMTLYKCDFCSYQTNNKRNFNSHLLTHKERSEVTIYKCDSCLYQTKRKRDLNKHLLKHKDPSEVTLYNCDSCSFQTKRTSSLKNHLLIHKNPSEVTMYKCDSCLYQTKHKYALKRHMLIHKNPSEVTMYKCDSCLYQTKHKYGLKRHLLMHIYRRDLAEL